MDAFFRRYMDVGGQRYRASWNASQTLGWRGEAGGVGVILDELHLRSGESWAIAGADLPAGCSAARQFLANVAVAAKNCFVVTSTTPSDAQVRARYARFTPSELKLLVDAFVRGRAAALATKFALAFNVSSNAKARAGLAAWRSAVQQFNRQVSKAADEIAAPMRRVAVDVVSLSNGTNCRALFGALRRCSAALGHDLVAKHVVLWACSTLLMVFCCGLMALYCLLWTVQHPGANGAGCCGQGSRKHYVNHLDISSHEDEDDLFE